MIINKGNLTLKLMAVELQIALCLTIPLFLKLCYVRLYCSSE